MLSRVSQQSFPLMSPGGLRGLEGGSAGAGSVDSAERRLSAHRSDHRLEVSRGVPPLHPPLLFYSSITKKVGKQAVSERHSTYRPVREAGRAGGGLL